MCEGIRSLLSPSCWKIGRLAGFWQRSCSGIISTGLILPMIVSVPIDRMIVPLGSGYLEECAEGPTVHRFALHRALS